MEAHATLPALTAHDRFKRQFSPALRAGIILATLIHFAIFALFPRLETAGFQVAGSAIEAVELPPQVEVPPPPEQIARPATPRIAAVEVSDDLTIAPTTFEENPASSLGPPPSIAADEADRPPFIPYDVAPRLKNRAEILAMLQGAYPRALRDAGIGGTVLLWIYVSEQGRVLESRIAQSSGYLPLDRAAQTVAARMEFTPAMNRDRVTPVWLSQPIDFSVTG